jgi:hypothetical protein
MRRLVAVAAVLALFAACSRKGIAPQRNGGGRLFGSGGGAGASTGTDTTSTDTTGTLKGGAGGGPGSGLAGATVTGLDTVGTQEWTPDVTESTTVSATAATATTTTTNPWHVPNMTDTGSTAATGTH